MKYIFIDTFAIDRLTKECYEELSYYLWQEGLRLLVTPMLLVEYFSPMLQRHDRTERAALLLLEHNFVIANQTNLMESEEKAYPEGLPALPVDWTSEGALQHMDDHDLFQLFYGLLHHGIPGTEYDLKSWAKRHHSEKLNWGESIETILDHARKTGTIKNKNLFVESLDLRLCDGLLKTIADLELPENQDAEFFKRISQLHRINEQHDTAILKGIHLSSLIIWYDYVIARKKVKPSDGADIMHALFYPYCSVVIADASRIDCIRRIQREDGLYRDVQVFTKTEFKQMLQANYPIIPNL